MSTSPQAIHSTLDIRPMTGALGAEIFGLDVNNIDDATFDAIYQAFLDGVGIPKLALPDNQRLPSKFFKLSNIFSVSFPILRYFGFPIVVLAFRQIPISTLVSVPETTMHENRLFPLPKHHIGRPGKSPFVQSVSVAQTVEQLSHHHFRAGVLASHARHDVTARLFRHSVDHAALAKGFLELLCS